MEHIFDPDIKISQQALARKQRFIQNKKTNIDTSGGKTNLPDIWFDDQGEIQAVTYDKTFQPDQNWHTSIFPSEILLKIKQGRASDYVVFRNADDKNIITYEIMPRTTASKNQITHDPGLVETVVFDGDSDVDVIVKITTTNISVSITDRGKLMLADYPTFYSKDTIHLYVTEPQNVHFLLETYKFSLQSLCKGEMSIQTPDYTNKSVYGVQPFTYGRL